MSRYEKWRTDYARYLSPAGDVWQDLASVLGQASDVQHRLVYTALEEQGRRDGVVPGPVMPLAPAVMPRRPPARLGRPTSESQDISVADFLNECMTEDQAQEILNELNIEFMPESGYASAVSNRKLVFMPACKFFVPSTGQPSFTLFGLMMKAFQLLKWIRFDAPMPVIGTVSPYEWMKMCDVKWDIYGYVKDGRTGQVIPSHAGGRGVNMHCFSAEGTYDLFSVIETADTMLHELRHTIPGGSKPHPCLSHAFRKQFGNSLGEQRCDYQIQDGGACAVSYWFLVWLRDHLRPMELTKDMSHIIETNIYYIWVFWFCVRRGQYQQQYAGSPPSDPSQIGVPASQLGDSQQRVFLGAGDPILSRSVTAQAPQPVVEYDVPLVLNQPAGTDLASYAYQRAIANIANTI